MLNAQQANWGLKTGFFFGATGAVATVVAYFTVPETKGRTYAELDELFEENVPTRKFGQYKTKVQIAAAERAETVTPA